MRADYQQIDSVVGEVVSTLKAMKNHEIPRGVPTGFREIDEHTQGLQSGQMIVVAGRPAMGKSTLGMDFARHAALHENLPTIIFSLEMSKSELAQRIISAESDVRMETLRHVDNISPEQWMKIENCAEAINGKPLYLDDSANMSLMEIRAKCRRLKQTVGLRLVVIDYLQLMSSEKEYESRQQEVAEFSRSLKLLAKELEIPVVALSQLNRGSELRTDHRPMLSDLRESGSIEQDADVVFLVHRPDFYERDTRTGEADIIMAKHRNGPTKTFSLSFQGANSRFCDLGPY